MNYITHNQINDISIFENGSTPDSYYVVTVLAGEHIGLTSVAETIDQALKDFRSQYDHPDLTHLSCVKVKTSFDIPAYGVSPTMTVEYISVKT